MGQHGERIELQMVENRRENNSGFRVIQNDHFPPKTARHLYLVSHIIHHFFPVDNTLCEMGSILKEELTKELR